MPWKKTTADRRRDARAYGTMTRCTECQARGITEWILVHRDRAW